MRQPGFAVVIPTLQRSAMLAALVARLDACPAVAEVLVVNNADSPLDLPGAKVRVVTPGGNIFVNPAWNLGVAQTTAPLVCLCNDDVDFDPAVLAAAARMLRWPVGLIGTSRHLLAGETVVDGRPRFRLAYHRTFGYGTLMMLRRRDYAPVPDALQIWCGDDWLFHRQRRRNLTFHGTRFSTVMSTTSGDPAFAPRLATEVAWFQAHRPTTYDRYLREGRLAERGRSVLGRLRARVARERNP